MLTLFEIAKNGIIGMRQGRRAMGVGNQCRYRSADGYKCFIGHSIPDHLYHRHMEGSISLLRESYPALGLPEGPLEALQRECHDSNCAPRGEKFFDKAKEESIKILQHMLSEEELAELERIPYVDTAASS